MAVYACRSAEVPRQAPRARWYRIARAWVDGTMRRAADRRYRNMVLRDLDAAIANAGSLRELFRVAKIAADRGILRDDPHTEAYLRRVERMAGDL